MPKTAPRRPPKQPPQAQLAPEEIARLQAEVDAMFGGSDIARLPGMVPSPDDPRMVGVSEDVNDPFTPGMGGWQDTASTRELFAPATVATYAKDMGPINRGYGRAAVLAPGSAAPDRNRRGDFGEDPRYERADTVAIEPDAELLAPALPASFAARSPRLLPSQLTVSRPPYDRPSRFGAALEENFVPSANIERRY